MIDFSRSTFTWQSHPWAPDPYYRWAGGFVGEPGQVYHVRFTLDAACRVRHPDGGEVEIFVGSPCRSEYTIASRNLFQIPSNEWRMAFSHECAVSIVAHIDETHPGEAAPLSERFAGHDIDIRHHEGERPLTDAGDIATATFDKAILNGLSSWLDDETGCEVELEYPVNVMNLNPDDGEWQVCTGPVAVPDPVSWLDGQIRRVFMAHVAMSATDHVELIFRRPVEVDGETAAWLDTPQGRDRLELRDPDNAPPGYPPGRPRPTAYHDVREYSARNAVLAVD